MKKKPVRTSDGLANVVAGLGTSRDKRSYSYWAQPRILTRDELENMYRGSWLSKRIINTVADDMTREAWHFMFDDNDKSKDNLFALEEFERELQLCDKINEAARWARLYGGAVILLGLNDTKDLSKPLNIDRLGKDCLQYAHVVDRWRINPSGTLNKKLDDPNFGQPDKYIISDSSVIIHHSRVLRFDGQKLPYYAWMNNGMWHDSELQHVVESVMNCDTATAGVSTMLFEANVDVIKSPGLTELLSSNDGEAKAIKRFQIASMMKSFNRTLLLDGEEEYEKKSNTFANLDSIIEQFMVDVCGAADIPMARLFGQTAGGLNSTGEQDVRNYYDMIRAKQKKEMSKQLDTLFEIMCRSVFGAMPKDFRWAFNPLWQMSDDIRADVDTKNAARDKTYLDAGVLTEGLIAKELKERGTYRTMTSEDVDMADELAEEAKANELELAKASLKPNGGNNGKPKED